MFCFVLFWVFRTGFPACECTRTLPRWPPRPAWEAVGNVIVSAVSFSDHHPGNTTGYSYCSAKGRPLAPELAGPWRLVGKSWNDCGRKSSSSQAAVLVCNMSWMERIFCAPLTQNFFILRYGDGVCIGLTLDCLFVCCVSVSRLSGFCLDSISWTTQSFVSNTWHGGASSWVGVSCGKFGVLTSRSKSQWGFM